VAQSNAWVPLEIHNNEKFLSSDFEFCTISLLVMHKYKVFDCANIGGGTIFLNSLKAKGNKKNFKLGQYFFKNH
jgi:hypothetical protein